MAVATYYDPKGNSLPQKAWATVVSAADGSATEYIGPLYGLLDTLIYTKTDYADTVDFTITKESTAEGVWAESNVTASDLTRPRVITQDLVDADSTTLVVREPILFAGERIKIVLAQAGATKTGKFTALLR